MTARTLDALYDRCVKRLIEWFERVWSQSPVKVASVLSGLVFLASIAVYAIWNALDGWAAAAGVAALTIIATITVVDRVIRGESIKRVELLAEGAIRTIYDEFRSFTECVARSYTTMADKSYYDAPDNAHEIMSSWLAEADQASSEGRFMQPPDADALLRSAAILADVLVETRASYLDVLPRDLLERIENFNPATQQAQTLFRSTSTSAGNPILRWGAVRGVVGAGLQLGEAIVRASGGLPISRFWLPKEEPHGRPWEAYQAEQSEQ